MKAFFDRLSDLITIEKARRRALAGKKAWLIAAGIEKRLPDGFEVHFRKNLQVFRHPISGSGLSVYGRGPAIARRKRNPNPEVWLYRDGLKSERDLIT